MRRIRTVSMAAAIAVASMGTAGAITVVSATPSAAATCTDNWQGPSTGTTNWGANAADWSTGFPGSSSVVCINEPGTYSVDLTGSVNVGSVQVGGATSGAQKLIVDGSSGSSYLGLAAASTVANGGTLSLTPTTNGYTWLNGGPVTVASGGSLTTSGTGNPVYLRAGITNNGTVSIGATDTRQDQDTATTNNGSFTVASGGNLSVSSGSDSFTNAGTLTVSGSLTESAGTFTQTSGSIVGNPVVITGGVIADTAGTGGIDVKGSASLSGTIPSGQTVTIDGSATSVTLNLTGTSVTDNGTVAMTPSTNGYTWLGGSPLTVAASAHFTTSGTGNPAYLRANITNNGTVSIGAANTLQDQNTATTNNASFTVASGGNLSLNAGSDTFTNAGTLTVSGSLTESAGTYTQTSGSIVGNPVVITGGTIVDTAGTGAIDVKGGASLSGDIPLGQTVTIDGSSTSVTLSLTGTSVTDNGSLVMTPTVDGYTWLGGSPVTVASGASLTTTGAGNPAYLRDNITNNGTVSIGAANTLQDQNTATSNNASFTVASGGNLAVTGGGTFTNAGTLTDTGSFSQNGGTYTQTSGSIVGRPVVITGGTIVDTAGTGAIDVQGGAAFSGNIPTGQTVTIDGAATSVVLNVTSPVTDNGTVAFAPTSNGYALVQGSPITVASGGILTTTGTGNPAYIRDNVTIQSGGTFSVGASDTRQDQSTTTANAGTFKVVNGGHYSLTGALTSTSSSVLGVTVNGTSGTGGISGSGLAVAGTLSVTTVGSPAVNTLFTPITGPVTGTFSTFSFGSDDYAVTYPSGAVQLQVEPAFTTTATPLAPKENIALTNPQVASIGSANDGTGTYSATVNYGDGSGVQTASVAVTGPNGTVTGPTHTYTTPGTYTVTATVSNTDGQTNTTSESVTVTGPVVTGFSKTEIKQSKSLTTVISGSGLDSSAVITTNNSGITVVSVQAGKVSKKHPNPTLKLKLKASATAPLGPVNVTITETGGTVTVTNALTVVVK